MVCEEDFNAICVRNEALRVRYVSLNMVFITDSCFSFVKVLEVFSLWVLSVANPRIVLLRIQLISYISVHVFIFTSRALLALLALRYGWIRAIQPPPPLFSIHKLCLKILRILLEGRFERSGVRCCWVQEFCERAMVRSTSPCKRNRLHHESLNILVLSAPPCHSQLPSPTSNCRCIYISSSSSSPLLSSGSPP